MSNPEQQPGSAKYAFRASAAVGVIAFLLVLIMHVLGIWGLIYGMGNGDSPPPPARPPIQTRVLPPPPPPPP
ncbi:MAG: energy transducer TonB, partial [Acetobacter fabarum]|nr:energy transducer TonB [Acetobacter fabarum]